VLAGLFGALGRTLRYPNDEALRRLPDLLAAAGLRPVTDQRRRYAYRLGSAADTELFLASLYLPDLPAARHRAARTVLHAATRMRAHVPVPIRRIVAVRAAQVGRTSRGATQGGVSPDGRRIPSTTPGYGGAMTYLPSLPRDAVLLHVFRAYPQAARPLLDYHQVVLRGPSPFTVAERELIAAYVSGLNACRYCHGVHTATAAVFGIAESTLAAALSDVDTARSTSG
jgi:AhpD family alkylhydroperoxidase